MIDSKPAMTPTDINSKPCVDTSRELKDTTMYRKIVGSLIYLTLTRPDIAFIVGVLSRFMQNPRRYHRATIRRVLRYVKATLDQGIVFNMESVCKLVGFCDADYADDLNI